MGLGDVRRQKSAQAELSRGRRGESPRAARSGEASTATHGHERPGNQFICLEQVLDAANMRAALKRVRKNKGSPGIDGMTVLELREYLVWNWERIRNELLSGTYQPQPVRLHEIPKNDGGIRKLGIPTVLDRLIQQAILQVLQPPFDATFSDHSYGYRPGRSAHGAIKAACAHIQSGKSWVVDVDLAAMFDRVNHDILMERLARRIADKRVLGLIRRFLSAGMMANGVVKERQEGTPQGGPLSPLLANVLLDEVDKELENRGLAFCRYADDANVYVGSARAGHDVMALLKTLYANLRLTINPSKSAVARPWERKFLGYSFYSRASGTIVPAIASASLEKMKDKVRNITRRRNGRNLSAVVEKLRAYLPGWKNYFRLTPEKEVFRSLDQWIRKRLRVMLLVQWKRGTTVVKRLLALGVPPDKARITANLSNRPYFAASRSFIHDVLPASYFNQLGVPVLAS